MKSQIVNINNIASVKGGKRLPKGHEFITTPIKHPYIRARDIGNGNIEVKEPVYIADSTFQKIRQYTVKNNDIVITIVGVNIGDVGIVTEILDGANLTENAAKISTNINVCNPNFLLCQLATPRNKFKFQQIAAGAAQGKLGLFKIKDFKILLPPINAQKNIADIYFTFTNLININRRRIQLLEESARLLFREWFVYFRFPGHEKVKIVKDGISKAPKGWGKEKVVNVVKRVTPGELYDQASAESTGIVPILDQGQSGIIGYHNNEPSVIASLNNPVIVFANHTCNQRIIHFPFSAIQNIFPFLPSDENYRNIYWLHYATDNLVQLNAYKGHWPEFMAKNIILPPADLCEKFGNIISMIHKQLFYLSIQNQKLAQARDLLLPRLMSGEIEV